MSFKRSVIFGLSETIKFCKCPLHKARGNRFNSLVRYMCQGHSSYSNEDNILRSKFPDVHIPDISLTEFIWKKLDCWPDKTAVVCGVSGQNYTYSQIRKKCTKFAVSLQKLGLQKGDVVAVVLPNIPDFAIAFLGSVEAGLIVTTVNPAYTPYEINKQLLDSQAKCIVTMTDLYPNVLEAVKSFHKPPPIIVTGRGSLPNGAIKFGELVDDSVDVSRLRKHAVHPEDVVVLPYSSGTTGLPKGVMLTHRNLIANSIQITTEPTLIITQPALGDHQDVVSAVLPLYHIYGMVVALISRFCDGCKVVTLPKFEPESFINSMVQYKKNILFLVPPLVLFLTNHPNVTKDHLKYVTHIMSGAAPLGQSDAERFLQKAGGNICFMQGYGMTESSPVTVQNPKASTKYSAAGILIPSTQGRVQDVKTGEFLGPNKVGELLFKGPQVMKGYLNNPEATKETLDSSGWLKTGDLGYYDEEHFFYVMDRLKELIKVKGFQVPPAELEEVLRSHPGVLEAAVIGIPDKRSGELPRAFVVPKKPGTLTEKELQDFVSSKVSEYKQLTGGVKFVDSIPKSGAGKILRRQVKEKYLN